MGMIQEFKEFALKGNMVDMAVGIVMGGAIGQLVASMVDNLINPVVGLFTGGGDLASGGIQIGTKIAEDGSEVPLVLNVGAFVSAFINFLILAFVIFMIIKMVNAAKKSLIKEKPAAPAGPSEVDLLIEIRDSLKK